MTVAPLDFGNVGTGTLFEGRHGAIRSYDHHSAVFSWQPPRRLNLARAAIDVEAKHQPSAAEMAAGFGLSVDEFLARWTATEAVAKVLDVPVLERLKRQGLTEVAADEWRADSSGVWMRNIPHQTHWVTAALIL